MKAYKSERLKKLEAELNDLQQWLNLGLVPKKELVKHKQEIEDLKGKISEEKERIQFLKESGDFEEIQTPKRGQTRTGYTEMPTIPDIDMGDTGYGRESQYEMTTEQTEGETTHYEEREEEETVVEKEEGTQFEEEEESYFSDKARWRRGGIQDPDADSW
jgi:hypothetical protein